MQLLCDIPSGTEVLVHICCAPDASYGVGALRERFDVTGFFYNPNIHPREETRKRLRATLDLQERVPFPLVVGAGGEEAWEEATRGMEAEPERGRRCVACVRLRLRETARKAAELGMPAFGTVLTVSPKKDAAMVNRVGREEGERSGVRFVEADLKKGDGYLKSVRASREMGLYRQRYCGCRYSMRGEPPLGERTEQGGPPNGDRKYGTGGDPAIVTPGGSAGGRIR
ncbi:MAG: epoxyqueuosine reductase QueH [Actinomycetota bacterium]